MQKTICAVLAVLVLLCGACQTDHPAKAVEKAREYALDHTQDLTEYQRHFIRYREPVIMQGLIFTQDRFRFLELDHVRTRFRDDAPVDPNYDFMHTAIVWDNIPGVEGAIVVDGTSLRNMRFWENVQVVRKRFVPENPLRAKARMTALRFALRNLPKLSVTEINRIRFAEPEFIRTTFPIEPKDTLDAAKEKGGWMEYLKQAAEDEESFQISAIWHMADGKKSIVVCGFSGDQSLADWKPETALILKESDLKKNLPAKRSSL